MSKAETTEHLSDMPYDSALIELIREHTFSRSVIIIAYELGRRKGKLQAMERYH